MRGIDISINISIWEEWRKESDHEWVWVKSGGCEYKYKYVNMSINMWILEGEWKYKYVNMRVIMRGSMRGNIDINVRGI